MKYKVITISREFGSGGHSMGGSVAKALDIPFYGQNLLEHIASETGFSQEFIQEASEYATAKNSLLFNLVMMGIDRCVGLILGSVDMEVSHV